LPQRSRAMELKEYNNLLVLYQLLTNSFVEIPAHYKDSFYKCYNKEYTVVKDENLKILKQFEDLTLRDFYKMESSTSNLPYAVEPFASMKLFVEHEEFYCVYVELGLLIFYYLVNYYQKAILHFLDILEEMSTDKYVPVKLLEGKIYEIDFYYLKSRESTFFGIEDFDKVFTLFGQSNNNIFYLNNNLEFIVEKYRIDNILRLLEKINFDSLND